MSSSRSLKVRLSTSNSTFFFGMSAFSRRGGFSRILEATVGAAYVEGRFHTFSWYEDLTFEEKKVNLKRVIQISCYEVVVMD